MMETEAKNLVTPLQLQLASHLLLPVGYMRAWYRVQQEDNNGILQSNSKLN